MFVSLALVAHLAVAQDSDGAVARIAHFQTQYVTRVSQMADAFEGLEKQLGFRRVTDLFVEHTVRSQREAFAAGIEKISDLTREQAIEGFSNLKAFVSDVGAPNVQRIYRNAERRIRDPHDRLRSVLQQTQLLDVRSGLERLLAQYDGVVSKALRAASDQASRETKDLRYPFRLTAAWIDHVGSDQRNYYANLIVSPVVLCFALGADLLILPFQLVFLGGEKIADWCSTSPEEQAEAEAAAQAVESKEKSDLRQEIEALKRRLSEIENPPSAAGEIRR